jgi:uncharacterized protein (DUF697 family)
MDESALQRKLGELRAQTPIPVFWLLGKTQTGKTSVVKFLTGVERAEIGRGFQPCTRFSSLYDFPDAETPLMRFLDTRGLDEPGYDPAEDLAAFDTQAHVVIVTVRLLDHAQESLVAALKRVRAARPGRPVILLVTTLHEAYPQQQHPMPYPYGTEAEANLPPALLESLEAHRKRFASLADRVVPIDLTPKEEGYHEPEYGGDVLRQALLDLLPEAQSQTFRALELAERGIHDLYAQRAMPTILAFSSMAATAGAVPVPLVDTALLAGVQSAMLHQLAKLYGHPLTRERMGELAAALGVGFLSRQMARSLIKFIPIIGTAIGAVTGAVLAGASTFALGKAFCVYYKAVLSGETPDMSKLKGYYEEQFALARASWNDLRTGGKKA